MGGTMRTTRITGNLLLAAALLAACSDHNALTAPSARPLAGTATLVDRPYTWSFACHGGLVFRAPCPLRPNKAGAPKGGAGGPPAPNPSGAAGAPRPPHSPPRTRGIRPPNRV